ncbi:putative spermidine/putrescine transport system ATP-binding protein [Roseovarius azorensis]|uniref:Spermidine/putrescine import ATP-binding protein PotA n=1 Tax=Roseovarius azorensis TaxID=1287727 RepID=A0A1H7XNK1_9RHOB|nr:ABC transporter ATP-binding protein [Roseovarius azorensis]SEM35360.1 putative spermidine/putrescine transport system ATP-binding protein [Roseovarius azorensis]
MSYLDPCDGEPLRAGYPVLSQEKTAGDTMKATRCSTSKPYGVAIDADRGSPGAKGVPVRLDGISKRFRSVVALRPTTLDIAPGLMTALLGPSGCGKTTTLRMLAGLEAPDEGRILIGGKDVTRVPPNRRGLGMVFQSYSLFPHMTIAENVSFGLRMAGMEPQEIASRTAEMLTLVRLPHIEDRYPNQLSGGQQQRVALARALVTNPAVLLLDEPLAALDRHLREEMQFELRRIQTSLQITTVIVTHDQEEALTMSDQVVVMSDGQTVQSGPPAEIYNQPKSRFVAEFLGTANLFDGVEDGQGNVRFAAGAGDGAVLARAEGTGRRELTVAIRPEKMWLCGQEAPASPATVGSDVGLSGRVTGHVFRGNNHVFQVAVAGREMPLVIYQQASNLDGPGFAQGDAVTVGWNPKNAVVLKD